MPVEESLFLNTLAFEFKKSKRSSIFRWKIEQITV